MNKGSGSTHITKKLLTQLLIDWDEHGRSSSEVLISACSSSQSILLSLTCPSTCSSTSSALEGRLECLGIQKSGGSINSRDKKGKDEMGCAGHSISTSFRRTGEEVWFLRIRCCQWTFWSWAKKPIPERCPRWSAGPSKSWFLAVSYHEKMTKSGLLPR